jgi:succinoglycan biosynthesis transport protein ExoP
VHSLPDAPGAGSENLPARSDERKLAAMTVARSNQQQLSLDFRTGQEPADDEDQINFLDYWRILVKRKWTVLATAAMVLVIALVSTLMTTPIYRSSATLQLERSSMQVVQVGGINTEGSADYSYDPDFQQTQMELLKSRALAERVVSQMGLLDSGEMDRLWPGSAWEKLTQLITGKPDKTDEPAPKPVPSEKNANERLNQLAGAFQGGFSVAPVGNSQLVKISYDSPDPQFSQRAANAIAESFVAQNLERRFDSTSYAKNYLEDRLQELKLKLEDSERKLVAFAQKEQIVSSGDTSGANLTEQNLGSLNAAYAKAKEDRIRAESRWQQAPSLRGTGLQNAIENPMIKTLQQSRANLLLEYQQKLQLYKPDYPVMQQLKGQIDEINKQIAAEEGNIRSGIQAEYQAALSQEHMLATQLTGLKSEVLDLQNRSIQYNIFKREVDTNRQLYDALLQRYKEIGVAGGVSANNISLVDRAEPGYKFKPDLSRNMKMAGLAGLMLGILLALAFEYLDDTIKRPEDIEKLLGLPVLGAIPLLKAPQTPEKAIQDVRSAFAEAYRSLRTALQFSTDRGVPRTLLITSATPSEGKSTTALVLGQYYAQLGKRVLIVDCDLRNPSLHRSLNVENNQGLSNYLAGAIKPTDLIRPTPTEGLMYLPTGPLPPNPAELLMGSKMVSLLTVAAEKFDLLILDGPPVMGLADAPILSNLAQGTLLVVQAGETRVAVVKNAIKRLSAARAHVVGGLLTHFRPEEAGQGYGYGGYNYYSYDSGRPQLTRR